MDLLRPVFQSAALPYRVTPDGSAGLDHLRPSLGHTPKGAIEIGHTFASSAAKEAFEEAGVTGDISPPAAGHYRTIKRTQRGGPARLEVWVHLMRVTRELDDWPEKGRRDLRWCPAATAAAQLDEPMAADLCRRLAA